MSPEAFLQEAEIMKKFSHPHLVAMYAVCTEQEPFYIITEFMCNGSLLDFLRKEDAKMRLQFDSLISIASQVFNFSFPYSYIFFFYESLWKIFSVLKSEADQRVSRNQKEIKVDLTCAPTGKNYLYV